MNTKIAKLLFISLSAASFLFSGCNKKCELPENVNSGEIVNSVSVFAQSGYMTAEMTSDQYLVTGSSDFADRFKMSTDGGITKTSVDYNEYSILCYPVTTSCYASFDRSVEIDDLNGVVVYKIRIQECGKCDDQRYIENFIAIRAIPDTYTVLFDVETSMVN